MSTIRRYAGTATAREVTLAVQSVVAADDEEVNAKLSELGITSEALLSGIQIRESASGIDSDTVQLIVTISIPVVTRAWDQWLLPVLRKKYGKDGLGDDLGGDAAGRPSYDDS